MNAREKLVAQEVVKCFLDAGYGVGVSYPDYRNALDYSKDLEEVMEHIGHADEEYIHARRKVGTGFNTVGYALLVFGNHASELLADCSEGVVAILKPAFDLQDTFQIGGDQFSSLPFKGRT